MSAVEKDEIDADEANKIITSLRDLIQVTIDNDLASVYVPLNENNIDLSQIEIITEQEEEKNKFTKKSKSQVEDDTDYAGETDTNKIAIIKKTNAAAKWVRENRDLIAKYPEGSGFFIPYAGEFNFDDYTFLKREGYTEAVPIDDFLKKVTVAEDKRSYYELKKTFDERLDNTFSPSLKAAIRDEWSLTKEDFLSDKPLLIQELETRQSKQQIVNAVIDLRSMVDSGDAPKTELTRKYKQMLDAYDKADLMLKMLTSDTKVQRNQKEAIRQNAYRKIQEIAQGDPQAEMTVRVLFSELLGV